MLHSLAKLLAFHDECCRNCSKAYLSLIKAKKSWLGQDWSWSEKGGNICWFCTHVLCSFHNWSMRYQWWISGERREARWGCSVEQFFPRNLSRCWWRHKKSHEKIICKASELIIIVCLWSGTQSSKSDGNICCAFCLTTKGGVQRHGAVDELERSGHEEGGRKPSWWNGDEEMGVLSLCFDNNGESVVNKHNC